MTARTNASPPVAATASTAGVLRPEEFARHVTLERPPAGPAVTRWVENHWRLRWDLPEGRRFPSQVVAHPTCSLTAELGTHRRPEADALGTLLITGVATRRFDVDVRGAGRVLGVRFRPGGLTALTGVSAATWTDRSVAASDALPRAMCDALTDPTLIAQPDEWQCVAESALAELAPEHDAEYDRLLAVVGSMLTDRSLVTVADVARTHGMSVRTLQRLFAYWVGAGPKWVLTRYRMHDAIEEIDAGYDGTLIDLAIRFGWYDHAHFTRDFTALVGVAPRDYIAAARRGNGKPDRAAQQVE